MSTPLIHPQDAPIVFNVIKSWLIHNPVTIAHLDAWKKTRRQEILVNVKTMILTIIVPALLCCTYSSAQFVPPPTLKPLPNDRTNWQEVWKTLKSNGMSRTDDPGLTVFDQILRVNAKERGSINSRSDANIFLFEGDIRIPKREVEKIIREGTSRHKRAVMKKTSTNLWRRTINYVIDRRLGARAVSVVRSAIREWQTTLPCMGNWRDVTNGRRPRDYMHFFPGGGCYSQVGRVGGGQRVSIGRGCEYHGIAVHEIGHAMGLWHEQSRPDRDSYVTIYWNNIIPAMRFNFQKHSRSRVDSLGVPYDYGSVMHYGATAFARARGLKTIGNIRNSQTLGQRRGLSPSDKKQVQLLYGCTTTVKPTGCKDTPSHRNWCAESQKLGLCRNSLFSSYMTTHCCTKCRQTKPTPKPTPKPAGCSDTQTPANCAAWQKAGYCNKGSRFEPYVKKRCCKTCQPDKVVTKNCVDKNKNCPKWKNTGYCNDGKYGAYMRENCKKSCFC